MRPTMEIQYGSDGSYSLKNAGCEGRIHLGNQSRGNLGGSQVVLVVGKVEALPDLLTG